MPNSQSYFRNARISDRFLAHAIGQSNAAAIVNRHAAIVIDGRPSACATRIMIAAAETISTAVPSTA